MLTSVLLGLAGLGSASAAPGSYGGSIVVGLSFGDAGSLDPTIDGSISAHEIYQSICESPYEYNSKSVLVPELAAALPSTSSDKLTYTIPLRTPDGNRHLAFAQYA